MSSRAANRYALFSDDDEQPVSPNSPVGDITHGPCHNQFTDDSDTWKEVKKHSAPTVLSARRSTDITLFSDDRPRSKPNHTVADQHRARAISVVTTESSDKPFDHENWCGICSQKFINKGALLSHMKLSPEHQHYCNLCKRVFKDFNGLKNHVDNARNHDIFCNLCLSAFKDEWGLRNHFENNDHIGHEFACLTCLLAFKTQIELERHLQTAEKHTWCQSCNRRFRSQDERDEHWQRTKKHKHCLQPGCDFDGPDELTLIQHLNQDHFQCEGCKDIFPSQTKLNRHYEVCTSTFTCPRCRESCESKAQMAFHLPYCYFCEYCGHHTNHKGNYQIHMTKHNSPSMTCWGCDAEMRTYSSLINHVESGKCPSMKDTTLLMHCLGKWWYSPLYMDLDIHAQVRTNRIKLEELQQWMDEGLLHPFICRAEGCGMTFGHLSSLVLHCESKACSWDVARLNLAGLEMEAKNICVIRNGTAT
ncbi:hypothetical protein BKA66DRAFT_428914 [Pyrenochaeta sp. MPI-SDFR-AT-0127]|nr:hypothetical protein BKA66DRAFT_428914 [Pyrenochaeta sp. MPI-SDFR-AT-0127]